MKVSSKLFENFGNRTDAYIERSLSLKFGTLQKWRRGKMKSDEIALLKLISNLPWIIEVAENGFKPDYAQFRMVCAAIKEEFKSL